MAEKPATIRSLVAAFTDFLTVAIHTILYERKVYPQTSFLSARKYNFPVHQSRHPSVCEWINDAIAALEIELLKGVVERVAVVLYTNEIEIVNRFMFDVARFPVVPASDHDTPLLRTLPDGEQVLALPTVDVEEQFRAAMSKLANCSAVLGPPPEKSSFTLAIELKKGGEAPLSHPQPWMPAHRGTTDSINDQSTRKAIPLRAVSAGEMVFEMWME